MLANILCTDVDSVYDNKASLGLNFEGRGMASVCSTAHKGVRKRERGKGRTRERESEEMRTHIAIPS